MRILHLSDLHYGHRYKENINRMLPTLLEKVIEENIKERIDLILFTGDLVWCGNSIENFNEVNDLIIEPLLKAVSLTKKEFIICPGNHDMTDKPELQAISEYINRFKNNESLDEFVKTKDRQYEISLEKSETFHNFMKGFYNRNSFEKLYYVFEIESHGKTIGIISFNTPWRSFIGEDAGCLLLPRNVICEALDSIPNKDIYISLMHHPINELKMYNRYEVEDIICEKFHMNFSGHYHKKMQSMVFTHDIGMLSVASMATMSGNDNSNVGFSIIGIDVDYFDIILTNYSYIKHDNIFHQTSQNNQCLPMNEEKSDQVNILKRLKDLYDDVLIDANSLLINYESSEDKSFLKNFNDPVLKQKSYFETIETKNNQTPIEFNKLIDNNFILYGKDKYGKTSILRKIQLSIIENFTRYKIIPIYFDLQNDKTISNYDLIGRIKSIFHITNKKSEILISKNKLQFLLDNFNHDNNLHIEFVHKLIDWVCDIRITLTSEETQECFLKKIIINKIHFDRVFIHPISRKHIRTQTSKTLTDYNDERTQEVVDKISLIFNQMNIPFNYWHLSLFLWIYKKEKNIRTNDNIEMLTLYIDKLLEREQIVSFDRNIDYELFKKLLGALAFSLLKEHQEENYCINYESFVAFVSKFKEENIRFVTDVKEIIDYLIDKGIIKKIKSTGKYTFRLNAVMEYFIAFYMVENNDFLEEVLNDQYYYLSFSNEIEILSGLNRKDKNLLQKLYDKTNLALLKVNSSYSGSSDKILTDKIKHSKDIAKTIKEINISDHLPICPEERDELLDEMNPVNNYSEEVKIKKPIELNEEYTLQQLQRHVFILSRSFRSLSLIDDLEQMKLTFDLIITSYINLGFEYLNAIDFAAEKSEKDIESKIIGVLSNFIPLVTQLMISDAVLHKNIARLIEIKIIELEDKKKENQYKLMILYFMLLDIDLKTHRSKVDKIVENINILSLNNACIIKLFYYLVLKSNGDKELESFLKSRIIEIQLKHDDSKNKAELINNLNQEVRQKKMIQTVK